MEERKFRKNEKLRDIKRLKRRKELEKQMQKHFMSITKIHLINYRKTARKTTLKI